MLAPRHPDVRPAPYGWRAVPRAPRGNRRNRRDGVRGPAAFASTVRRRSTTRDRRSRTVGRSCATSGRHARVRQRLAQPMDGRVELALDGSFRQTQRVGNLAEFHASIMAHHEYDALSFRQAANFDLEDLADLPGVGAFFRTGG